MTRAPIDPTAGITPVSRRVARAAAPGGPSSVRPVTEEGGKTPRPALIPPTPGGDQPPVPGTAAGSPSGETAAVRGRARTPAGGATVADASLPAGLQGAEWRKAVKDAQAKNRRRKTPTPTTRRPVPSSSLPAPPSGSAGLTATAHCIGQCEWTAGPGAAADVDEAADKHTTRPPKHPTAVVAAISALKVATA